jgi:hypothetical protein
MMDSLFFGGSHFPPFSHFSHFSPFSPFSPFSHYRKSFPGHSQYRIITHPRTSSTPASLFPTKETTVDFGPFGGVWKFPPPRPATPPRDVSTTAHQAEHRATVDWHEDDKDLAASLGTLRSAFPSGGLTDMYKANIPVDHNDKYQLAKRAVSALTDAAKAHEGLSAHLSSEAASTLDSMARGKLISEEDASKGYWHGEMIERHLDETRNGDVPDVRHELVEPHTQSMALSLMLAGIDDLVPGLRSLMGSIKADATEEESAIREQASSLHSSISAIIKSAIGDGLEPWQDAETITAPVAAPETTEVSSQPDTVPIADGDATSPKRAGWRPKADATSTL